MTRVLLGRLQIGEAEELDVGLATLCTQVNAVSTIALFLLDFDRPRARRDRGLEEAELERRAAELQPAAAIAHFVHVADDSAGGDTRREIDAVGTHWPRCAFEL